MKLRVLSFLSISYSDYLRIEYIRSALMAAALHTGFDFELGRP